MFTDHTEPPAPILSSPLPNPSRRHQTCLAPSPLLSFSPRCATALERACRSGPPSYSTSSCPPRPRLSSVCATHPLRCATAPRSRITHNRPLHTPPLPFQPFIVVINYALPHDPIGSPPALCDRPRHQHALVLHQLLRPIPPHTLPIAHVLHTRTNVLGGFHLA